MRNYLLRVLAIVLGVGCGDDGGAGAESESESESEGEVDLSDIPDHCNPLSDDDCLAPFPSTAYLAPDDSTRTGWRVSLSSEALPANTEDVQLDTARFNAIDGFSAATYFVAYWPGGIDMSGLPPQDDPARSLDAASATVIVDMGTGELVPHFAELDANVETSENRQGLILRPVKRLDAGARYAIGISLAVGAAPSRGFQSLLDGTASNHATLERLRPDYDAIFAALEKAGMARDDMAVAWDMRTASDETYVEPMQAMVETGLAAVPDMAYVVTSVEDDVDSNILRLVEGTYDAPNFLLDCPNPLSVGDLAADRCWVSDPPEADGAYTAEFTLLIPRAAETAAPLPVLLFGHGLFGSGRSYIGGDLAVLFGDLADDYGYIVVGTDWIGLHEGDEDIVTTGLTDGNLLHATTERLRQAVVNTTALGRLTLDRFRTDADFLIGGEEVISPDMIQYWGISLGGIMGNTTLAYDPDISVGALGVPGGNWGMMIQRSSNWPDFRNIMRQWYPDYLDQVKLIGLTQALFDFSDPITTAARVLDDAPSGGPKQILMIEARCDSQVPNIATETVARTMGIPLLSPTLSPEPFGLDVTEGPLPSAIVRYEMGFYGTGDCPPDTNAPVEGDNGAHEFANTTGASLRQVAGLLLDGEVRNECFDGESPAACECDAGNCQ